MKKERAHWVPRVRELATEHPTWSEVDLTWALIEEMGVRGAAILAPVFDREDGRKGRLSLQTNPANYRDPARMLEQAVHFSEPRAEHPGQVPDDRRRPRGDRGGDRARRRDQRDGRVHGPPGDRRRRGRRPRPAPLRGGRRRREPVQPGLHDDGRAARRLDEGPRRARRHRADPDAANWAGIAVFKRAYGIYQERGYRTRLLAAAYRHRLHWTELVGGDVVLTMPHAWQVAVQRERDRPGASDRRPGRPRDVDDLLRRIPDFRRAYEPDGLAIDEFASYGATARTLRGVRRRLPRPAGHGPRHRPAQPGRPRRLTR